MPEIKRPCLFLSVYIFSQILFLAGVVEKMVSNSTVTVVNGQSCWSCTRKDTYGNEWQVEIQAFQEMPKLGHRGVPLKAITAGFGFRNWQVINGQNHNWSCTAGFRNVGASSGALSILVQKRACGSELMKVSEWCYLMDLICMTFVGGMLLLSARQLLLCILIRCLLIFVESSIWCMYLCIYMYGYYIFV